MKTAKNHKRILCMDVFIINKHSNKSKYLKANIFHDKIIFKFKKIMSKITNCHNRSWFNFSKNDLTVVFKLSHDK